MIRQKSKVKPGKVKAGKAKASKKTGGVSTAKTAKSLAKTTRKTKRPASKTGVTSRKAVAKRSGPKPAVTRSAKSSASNSRSASNSSVRSKPLAPSKLRPASDDSYADVLEFLTEFESPDGEGGADSRHTLSGSALARLQRRHAGLPTDYVDYLREVGWGSFMRCRYTVHQQLTPVAERLGKEIAARLGQPILCFGDNLAGDVAGFLPDHDWAVVEIDHLDFTVHDTGQSFGRFIRERMGMEG